MAQSLAMQQKEKTVWGLEWALLWDAQRSSGSTLWIQGWPCRSYKLALKHNVRGGAPDAFPTMTGSLAWCVVPQGRNLIWKYKLLFHIKWYPHFECLKLDHEPVEFVLTLMAWDALNAAYLLIKPSMDSFRWTHFSSRALYSVAQSRVPRVTLGASFILSSYLVSHRACPCYSLSSFWIHLLLSISGATTPLQAPVVSFPDVHNHLQIACPTSTLGPLHSIHHIIAWENFKNANQMTVFTILFE